MSDAEKNKVIADTLEQYKNVKHNLGTVDSRLRLISHSLSDTVRALQEIVPRQVAFGHSDSKSLTALLEEFPSKEEIKRLLEEHEQLSLRLIELSAMRDKFIG